MPMKSSAGCALPEVAPALRPVHDSVPVGSRRRTWRARRTGTRPVPLRRHPAGAAHREAGGGPRRRPARRRPGPADRHRADDPGFGKGADPRLASRTFAHAVARGSGTAARSTDLLGDPLRTLPLRMEPARRSDGRRLSAVKAPGEERTISSTIRSNATISPGRRPVSRTTRIGQRSSRNSSNRSTGSQGGPKRLGPRRFPRMNAISCKHSVTRRLTSIPKRRGRERRARSERQTRDRRSLPLGREARRRSEVESGHRLLHGVAKRSREHAFWTQIAVYATRVERFDVAADAWSRLAALLPARADIHLRAAETLVSCASWTRRACTLRWRQSWRDRDAAGRAAAHALLAGSRPTARRGRSPSAGRPGAAVRRLLPDAGVCRRTAPLRPGTVRGGAAAVRARAPRRGRPMGDRYPSCTFMLPTRWCGSSG